MKKEQIHPASPIHSESPPSSMLPESVWIGTVEYPLDPDTARRLKDGEISPELKARIKDAQGDDFCFEFCRQRRLMKRILDQIREGKQPEHLRSIVESGTVPPEILYKLYHKKLIGKVEKLHQSRLVSDEILSIVRDKLLTHEIIQPLSHAFLVDTAVYLHAHQEISQEILKEVKDGTIDPVYIRVIRRHYRYMTHLEELQEKHSVHALDKDKNPVANLNASVQDTVQTYDFDTNSYFAKKLLEEAVGWLTDKEKKLLELIYFDTLPLTAIAAQYGVTEGTIRYHRDQLLKRLRFILLEFMKVNPDDLFL